MKRILQGLTLVACLIGLPSGGQAQVAAGVSWPNVSHIVAGGYTLAEQPTPYGRPRTWTLTSTSAPGPLTLIENYRDASGLFLHDQTNLAYFFEFPLKLLKTSRLSSTSVSGLPMPATPPQSVPVIEADAVVNGFNATGADVVGGAYRMTAAGEWRDSVGNLYSEAARDASSVYLNGPAGRTTIDFSRRILVRPNNAMAPVGAAYTAATATPTPPSNLSPVVAGSAIGAAELKATLQWIAYELQIDNLSICNKLSYNNGPPKLPVDCGAGSAAIHGACFPDCKAGYGRNGGSYSCVEICPPGYSDKDSFCHFNNPIYDVDHTITQSCYTVRPASCTTVNQTCSPNVCVPIFGCTGSICSGGHQECTAAVQHCDPVANDVACRTGYRQQGPFCVWASMPPSGDWTGAPSDPIKHTYGLPPVGAPHCSGSDVLTGNGCFPAAKSNYTCRSDGFCAQTCASGTLDCGAGTCAASRQSCGLSVGNTLVGPLTVVVNIAADSAGGAAIFAARDSIKGANDILQTGRDGVGATAGIQSSLQIAMNTTRNTLAAVTSPDIEAQIAGKWGKWSAAYDTIGRSWALVDIEVLLLRGGVDPAGFTESLTDESGVISTIASHANPHCEQRTAIP